MALRLFRSAKFVPSRRFATQEKTVLDLYDHVQQHLLDLGPQIHENLNRKGVGFMVVDNVMGSEWLAQMRAEADGLYVAKKFTQSESEIMDEHGEMKRFDKQNVFAYEMDGTELESAPALIHYTAAVMHTLPQVINHYFADEDIRISSSSYGTKLAVALGDGSKYPKHVDNVGLPDTRKLTCVFYLNPDWDERNGGAIRVFGHPDIVEDVSPIGDRLVMFWSDQIVHEVLENYGVLGEENSKRFALTLWLVSENEECIADQNHPLSKIRFEHFPEY
jgi:Rps23 Pro-64 3,4-dihydroxylase Tpa1-like proline 4-hydroxylase